jgi:hypothetical protein
VNAPSGGRRIVIFTPAAAESRQGVERDEERAIKLSFLLVGGEISSFCWAGQGRPAQISPPQLFIYPLILYTSAMCTSSAVFAALKASAANGVT